MRTPSVETQQNRSIRVENLTEVGMGRIGRWLAEKRLIPFEADRNVTYADDCPSAFNEISPATRGSGSRGRGLKR